MAASKAKDDDAAPDTADEAAPDTADDAAPAAGPADGDGESSGQADDTAAEPSMPGAPAAAPVTAPKKRRRAEPDPSTAVEPNAAMRETPGSHVALVDHEGNDLGPDDLFVDEGAHRTWVLAAKRIYQKFRYPGTQTVTTQLLYPANARVPRDHAERVKTTLREQLASNGDGKLPVYDLRRGNRCQGSRAAYGRARRFCSGVGPPRPPWSKGGRRRAAAAPA